MYHTAVEWQQTAEKSRIGRGRSEYQLHSCWPHQRNEPKDQSTFLALLLLCASLLLGSSSPHLLYFFPLSLPDSTRRDGQQGSRETRPSRFLLRTAARLVHQFLILSVSLVAFWTLLSRAQQRRALASPARQNRGHQSLVKPGIVRRVEMPIREDPLLLLPPPPPLLHHHSRPFFILPSSTPGFEHTAASPLTLSEEFLLFFKSRLSAQFRYSAFSIFFFLRFWKKNTTYYCGWESSMHVHVQSTAFER